MATLDRRVAALEQATPPRLYRPDGMSTGDLFALLPSLSLDEIPAFVNAMTHAELKECREALKQFQQDRKDSDVD